MTEETIILDRPAVVAFYADVEPEHQAAPEPRRVVSARRVTLFLAHSEVTRDA